MTWLERIKDGRLETADGNIYTFEFKEITAAREERTEKFSFRSDGDYISRNSSGSTSYPLKIWFSGRDCDLVADSFELATKDPRPLKFYHPIRKKYVLVQLLSIERTDDTLTAAGEIGFALQLHETIELDKVIKPESASRYVDETVSKVKILSSEKFGEEIAASSPSAIDKMKADIAKAQAALGEVTTAYDTVTDGVAEFQSVLLSCESLVETIEADAEAFANLAFGAVTTVNSIITFVTDRVDAIKNLIDTIGEMESMPIKKIYWQAAVSAKAQCALSASSLDFKTRTEAFALLDSLDADFQAMRDAIETAELSGELQIPDMETMIGMQDIVATTFGAFAGIAYGAKQQRSITLEKNEAIYPLVYRLMGGNSMDDLDTLVDEFIAANELGGSELFELQHGKTYRYYL